MKEKHFQTNESEKNFQELTWHSKNVHSSEKGKDSR